MALVVCGAPIWVALVAGSSVSLLIGYGLDPSIIASQLFNTINNSTLLAVPLFILAGQLLNQGGATRPIIDLLVKFMGHLPGGPAYAVILGCAVIASMSSTGLVAVAGFAPVIVPMMEQMGYSRRFSIGLLVASSTLGSMIPPSIPLIIYGWLTETSVKDLYAAAFIPGGLMMALLAVTVFIHSKRGHYGAPPPSTWRERRQALWRGLPVLGMPIAVLLPIYTGWDTPTEASAVAVVYALLLGMVFYRELDPKGFWLACTSTVRVTAMVFAIVMGALLLNLVVTYMGLAIDMGEAIANAGLHWMLFLLVVILVYFAMGTILDPTTILLVLTPIVLPALVDAGVSPVTFGVLVVISIELAGITPPYGLTLFAASGVINEKYSLVARGCLMFYPALILGQLLIAYVDKLTLFFI